MVISHVMSRQSYSLFPPLLFLAIFSLIGWLLFFFMGQHKPPIQWNWVDIVGEGGAALFVMIWLWLIVRSRPRGRVTNFFVYGLSLVFFHLWMDTLDEFYRVPQNMMWDTWLESIPFPIGLFLVTLGFYYWHHEQLAISRQLAKREQIFRDHRFFDALVPLADANYFKQHLQLVIDKQQHQSSPACAILVDMQDFQKINQQYGFDEGSAILQYVSQLISLNLRQKDLLCRLAGDRFSILLPETSILAAQKIAQQLQQMIESNAYYQQHTHHRIRLSARTTSIAIEHTTASEVLKQLNQQLFQLKHSAHYFEVTI
ncbi:diguanylate cyclase [Acinetobacter qingfengensis]|uniref:diguanylate cyclase n=2 Tax=Acinetobacter qingfengensis TaxID=1262585 RepID=A0A1E7R595_9GAMM|nr:diguanylate cyclase [Acinetobacter qingfengensis]